MEGMSKIRPGSNGDSEHKLYYDSLRQGFKVIMGMQNDRYFLLGKGETRRVYDTVRETLTTDYQVTLPRPSLSDRELELRASKMSPRFPLRR